MLAFGIRKCTWAHDNAERHFHTRAIGNTVVGIRNLTLCAKIFCRCAALNTVIIYHTTSLPISRYTRMSFEMEKIYFNSQYVFFQCKVVACSLRGGREEEGYETVREGRSVMDMFGMGAWFHIRPGPVQDPGSWTRPSMTQLPVCFSVQTVHHVPSERWIPGTCQWSRHTRTYHRALWGQLWKLMISQKMVASLQETQDITLKIGPFQAKPHALRVRRRKNQCLLQPSRNNHRRKWLLWTALLYRWSSVSA